MESSLLSPDQEIEGRIYAQSVWLGTWSWDAFGDHYIANDKEIQSYSEIAAAYGPLETVVVSKEWPLQIRMVEFAVDSMRL